MQLQTPGRDEQLIDASGVHVDDFEAPTFMDEMVAGIWDLT